MKLVVQGAENVSDVPGLQEAVTGMDVACAPDVEALAEHLPGADALLGWDFRGRDLADCWHRVDKLNWIHWCGAGVDAVLFPELANSDVVLTNARGVFDRAMAEYVLGYMLYETKHFNETLAKQRQGQWEYRMTSKLAGQSALIFGVGSIGREIARVLKAMHLNVSGVGRTARSGDGDFEAIHKSGNAQEVIGDADWIISVMPSTPDTDRLFNSNMFKAMKPTARFVNVGRGKAVDEAALLEALSQRTIAGAMLDVFDTEPLPSDSPMWQAPNLLISPHNSGDYRQHKTDLALGFLHNLLRYKDGRPLANIVNKQLGFVSDPS